MKIKEFVVFTDGNVLLTAENEEDVIGGIFLHSSCKTIKPSQFKLYKDILNTTVEEMNRRGLKVYATPVDEQDERWIKAYGFVETGLLLNGFKLLKHKGVE